MRKEQNTETDSLISTGVPGLDEILCGGLTRDRLYLVEGQPGSGKTTFGLQFLVEGAKQGERVLYISLAENAVELRAVAASHGLSMDGIQIHEVIPSESLLDPKEQYTMFHASEVELGSTTQEILAAVEAVRPSRVVLDSLSELQLLADNPLRYRRQVLAYKQYFASRACTVLLLDDRTASNADLQVHSIAHAVISLVQEAKEYGADRRRIRVSKYRGVEFRAGLHDYSIVRGGLVAYPRLVASTSRVTARREQFATGLEELDKLMGGGVEEGTSTLISGPPGTGKSSLAAQFVSAAVARGERAAMFIFEEAANNLINRAEGLGMRLAAALESEQLTIQQIDPAELPPGEFAHSVCAAADRGAKVIVIDSLNGYLSAMPDERFLTTHLHELLTWLGQRGVVTVLVGVHQGLIGGNSVASVDASYLADNVVLLRHYEADGEVRQAVSVFKKRGGPHERTLREFSMSSRGIHVGPVLRQFHGILTGVPTFRDGAQDGTGNGNAG
ncbi:ATPase domain-containing protein [Noviherbaspirillum sp.]|uniref:ATPase domain-containing protein n=1 Tax=Noviherbaspirillum sp. TaxID=1926288 RepID=UPI002D7002A4|nr:ATPase domain-containing protein [Noviherbaspirillum sp.]HZW19816.1 ATPase domain-containing protein [Noviherbaspirillum sp.]